MMIKRVLQIMLVGTRKVDEFYIRKVLVHHAFVFHTLFLHGMYYEHLNLSLYYEHLKVMGKHVKVIIILT